MADDRGPPFLCVRRGRELPPLLLARVAREADVAPGYGLRDDPAPREHRRLPALLGARDGTRRLGDRSPVDARLLSLTPARGSGRVSVSVSWTSRSRGIACVRRVP